MLKSWKRKNVGYTLKKIFRFYLGRLSIISLHFYTNNCGTFFKIPEPRINCFLAWIEEKLLKRNSAISWKLKKCKIANGHGLQCINN